MSLALICPLFVLHATADIHIDEYNVPQKRIPEFHYFLIIR